jgi:hypothetical protein
MDDATRAELADLQARAYGPAADIAADPAALARLHELEARARGGAPASSVPAAPVPRDPTAPIRPVASFPTPSPAAGPASEPVQDAAAPTRRRRLVRVLWPASVVVAAAVTAGAGWGIAGAGEPRLREVDRVQLSTDAVPATVMGDTNQGLSAANFHGLTVLTSKDSFGTPGVDCLTVFQLTQADNGEVIVDGPMYTGCSAGVLPAVVQLAVGGASPEGLRALYPMGTGLRFVLDGEEVRVMVADRVATPSAS